MTATIAPPTNPWDIPNDRTIATAQTMRAVVQKAYGGPGRMSMAEIEIPEIGSAEVLVQKRSAGLDRDTWHVMRGEPYVDRLARLIERGEMTPAIDRTYTLDEAPEAKRHLESGRIGGKVVIAIQ